MKLKNKLFFQLKFLLISSFMFAGAITSTIYSSPRYLNTVRDSLHEIRGSEYLSSPLAGCSSSNNYSVALPRPSSDMTDEQAVRTQLDNLSLLKQRLRGGMQVEPVSSDDPDYRDPIRGSEDSTFLPVIPTLEALLADANAEDVGIPGRRSVSSYAAEIQEDLNEARRLLAIIEQRHRRLQFCEFKKQLDQEIQEMTGPGKQNLEQLKQVVNCLENQEVLNGQVSPQFSETAENTFAAIFDDYSDNESLTDDDCEVLEQTYQVWSSFYESQNANNLNQSGSEIPLYNVNPHNSSYYYWAQEYAKGTIPEGGLTLLHADTHTDLGHIHEHVRDDVYRGIDSSQIPGLLRDANVSKEAFLTSLRGVVNQSSEDNRVMMNAFNSQSQGEIINSLELLTRRSVHEIAQPLVGAVNGGLSSKLIMCLPPWSEQLPRTDYQSISLVDYNYRSNSAHSSRQLMSTNPELTGDSSPIIYPNKYSNQTVLRDDVSMAVTDCNQEERDENGHVVMSQTPLDGFDSLMGDHERENGFILDIDLDVFVSEGCVSNSNCSDDEPISWERSGTENQSHQAQLGDHGGHDQSNETDSDIQVTARELALIKDRVDNFFDRLQDAKDQGILPAVITISDSTVLSRMIAGQNDDSINGGLFTPSCLVFYLNYLVKQRLNEMYSIRNGNEE